jgi:gluconate 2-dehydrogenase gamma chain
MHRRTLIKSLAGLGSAAAAADTLAAEIGSRTVLRTDVSPEALPQPARQGGLAFLTAREAEIVGAVFERLIPTDELGAGARDAGCVEFLDNQLAGDFGQATAIYRLGPFVPGTPQQGPQYKETPAERYRLGLAALDEQAKALNGKAFAMLDANKQDDMLRQLEAGQLALTGLDSAAFFKLMLQNVREGYFSDPMYGGNRNMVGWKMVGFPGARYDYRDLIGKKGQKLDLIPISILGRSA